MDGFVKSRYTMKKSLIAQHNPSQFIYDINRVTEVMVYAESTNEFLKTTKKEVLEIAETKKIRYYLKDNVFKVKRLVMIVT